MQTSFVAIAYPEISQKDFDWIQNIRKDSDELYYEVVKPHFTFVFPCFSIDENSFIGHAQKIISGFRKIDFELRKAITNKDAFNDYIHVFLVPDKGKQEIIELHDKLYSGILKKELREDIPYIPHIGIGSSLDKDKSLDLANSLNKNNISIRGKISFIDICRFEGNKIETIKRVGLKELAK